MILNTLRSLFKRWFPYDAADAGWVGHGPDERPPGYNDAVLHWFHAGPEGRIRTAEFSGAFAERAAQHPAIRRERLLASAAQFRSAAHDCPAVIENVEPVLRDAMVQSFITQAERLEAEAADLALPRDEA